MSKDIKQSSSPATVVCPVCLKRISTADEQHFKSKHQREISKWRCNGSLSEAKIALVKPFESRKQKVENYLFVLANHQILLSTKVSKVQKEICTHFLKNMLEN